MTWLGSRISELTPLIVCATNPNRDLMNPPLGYSPFIRGTSLRFVFCLKKKKYLDNQTQLEKKTFHYNFSDVVRGRGGVVDSLFLFDPSPSCSHSSICVSHLDFYLYFFIHLYPWDILGSPLDLVLSRYVLFCTCGECFKILYTKCLCFVCQ